MGSYRQDTIYVNVNDKIVNTHHAIITLPQLSRLFCLNMQVRRINNWIWERSALLSLGCNSICSAKLSTPHFQPPVSPPIFESFDELCNIELVVLNNVFLERKVALCYCIFRCRTGHVSTRDTSMYRWSSFPYPRYSAELVSAKSALFGYSPVYKAQWYPGRTSLFLNILLPAIGHRTTY